MMTAYTNMRHPSITSNVMNITDIVVQTGFSVVTFKPKVRATLPTHLLVDNRALCKEVQIDESGMVQTKTGGHEVSLSLLPQLVDMNDMDDITTLAKQVAEMRPCMGFSILGTDGPQYWWSMVEDCGRARFHGMGCLIGLPASQANSNSPCIPCQESRWRRLHGKPNIDADEELLSDDIDDTVDLCDDDDSDLTNIIQSPKKNPPFEQSNAL